ncbi:MAG: NAD(P)H:quinone oxidoreductase [Acidimicrobiales bacterium]
MTKISVIYYSATGNLHKMAEAIGEGASDLGAEVRVRRVAELAPAESIEQNPKWAEHLAWATENVEVATLDDLEWADGIALGSPTRFGLPAAQLKQLLDQSGGLWFKGAMIDKVVTAFTSASTTHGGVESTTLALLNTAYHWGSIVLPLGYTDDIVKAAGNPYGSSFVSQKGSSPDEQALAVARFQGTRLAKVSGALLAGS